MKCDLEIFGRQAFGRDTGQVQRRVGQRRALCLGVLLRVPAVWCGLGVRASLSLHELDFDECSDTVKSCLSPEWLPGSLPLRGLWAPLISFSPLDSGA